GREAIGPTPEEVTGNLLPCDLTKIVRCEQIEVPIGVEVGDAVTHGRPAGKPLRIPLPKAARRAPEDHGAHVVMVLDGVVVAAGDQIEVTVGVEIGRLEVDRIGYAELRLAIGVETSRTVPENTQSVQISGAHGDVEPSV